MLRGLTSIRKMSSVTKFDYLVLGAGSGGIASARRSTEFGTNAAVIEHGRLGGTCVNVGCVPKKIMYCSASIAETLHDCKGYGFELNAKPTFSWKNVKDRRDAYILRLNGIYDSMLTNTKVDKILGHGVFTGEKDPYPIISVAGKKYTAPHILIATGGYPIIPSEEEIPGAQVCVIPFVLAVLINWI